MLESQARSSIRWSKSIAQPSVTALSPSRFSSIRRSGSVNAKCSVWPASWKSAYQSSGPPCGWITSITLPGISIGAQKARGLLVGRSSTSRWTFDCASRSMPRFAERASQRRQHPVGGEGLVPARAAEEAADVVALRFGEPDPDALAKRAVHRVLVEPLGRVEQGAALSGEAFEVVVEPIAVEVEVGRRVELGDGALRSAGRRRGGAGSGAPRSGRSAPPRAGRACRGRRCWRSSAAASGSRPSRPRAASRATPRARRSSPRARASARRSSPRSRTGRAPGSRARRPPARAA